MSPKVSVIVPNYNHARFLRQRLDSIFNQTYQDFELIILDDCSTDNSKEIIEKYREHPKVSQIIYNDKNSGSPFKQWAKGFDLAQGEYIWIAESDDWAEVHFLKKGHCVEYFTFKKGLVSDKIEKLGVKYRSRMFYDLILANHYNVVEHLHKRGYIVQTCHGIFSDMERPSFKADAYVAISYEVQEHLLGIGIKSHLFLNGVDCSRFYEQSKISTQLQTILSLSQSEKANDVIQEACLAQKVKFIKSNKFVENDYEIEKKINEADLVIGIGRSLYDAMACGRAVISFDHRKYGDAYGDGYLTKNNIEESILYNCSGRYSKKILTASDLVDEMQKYSAKDGAFFREFACKRLNIVNVTAEYLLLAPSNKKIFLKFCKLLTLVKYNVYWSVKIGLIKMKIINR